MLKNKMFYKKLTCLLISLILLCSLALTGCSGENFYMYFAIDTIPRNVDPQKAQSYGELLAVRNCFSGLTKQNENGEAVLDLAESVDISKDELTYTFKLKQSTWKDGSSVTSDDFIFALTRATDPITSTPFPALLECISGATERLQGNTNAILGVTAPSPDTIVFKLTKPDSTFLLNLSRSVYMPCNRDFFEDCGGKYGLDRKHILTNGTYYISQWLEDRHLKLSLVNEIQHKYHIPENVFLTVSAKNKSNVQRIMDNEVGMTVDATNDFLAVDTSKFTVKTLNLKSYCIVINRNTEFGANELLTNAFAQSINHESYAVNMSERFKRANTILPENTIVFTKQHNSTSSPEYKFIFNSEKSRADYLTGLKQMPGKKLPDIKVLTTNNAEIKAITTDIVSQWQSNLGAYLNIKTVSGETELLNIVKNGDFTIAFIPITGNAYEILSKFSDPTSALYLNNQLYDNAIMQLHNANDNSSAQTAVNSALQILSQDPCVIPVIDVPTSFIYSKDYNSVQFSELDGTIDFSIIYKK